MEVIAPGAVSSQLQLQSPAQTRNWLVLKEGYLVKTKVVKRALGLHKSSKLRWFVLKQNPETLESHLEYYEGLQLRGSTSLKDATVKPSKQRGSFEVHTPKRTMIPSRTFHLAVDNDDGKLATSWVLALQKSIHAHSREREATVSKSKKAPLVPTRDAPPAPVPAVEKLAEGE
jgi:hypothetical protein